MRIKYYFITTLLVLLFSIVSPAQAKMYPNSKLVKLFDGAFFTEGPAYGPDGNIYFSDVTFTDETKMDAGNIWKYDSRSGKVSIYRSPSGMSNGIDFDNYGNMIVCEGSDFGGRRITKTDMKTGKSKILTALYHGNPYNSPNDLVVDSKNRIYFTDPKYVGYEKPEQPCFGVYKIEQNQVTLLIDSIKMPNGIALSFDSKKLFIGCNYEGDNQNNIKPENAIYSYDIDPYGNCSNGHLFIRLPDDSFPDGIITDRNENVYVAIRNEAKPAIYVYNKNAILIDTINLPEIPSNLTFGKGKEKNTLFITAGGSLYRIK